MEMKESNETVPKHIKRLLLERRSGMRGGRAHFRKCATDYSKRTTGTRFELKRDEKVHGKELYRDLKGVEVQILQADYEEYPAAQVRAFFLLPVHRAAL